MRSRDGNLTFTLTLCLLIFLSTIKLSAEEYLISYRYTVKDVTLYNESLQISKSMRKCEGQESQPIYLQTHSKENIKQIIDANFEEFINYIHKLGLDVNHKESTVDLQNKPITILTLKTTCFKVDFNDNFARIAPLK